MQIGKKHTATSKESCESVCPVREAQSAISDSTSAKYATARKADHRNAPMTAPLATPFAANTRTVITAFTATAAKNHIKTEMSECEKCTPLF